MNASAARLTTVKVNFRLTYLFVANALNQNQAPENDKSFDRVRKGMSLVCPCHVRRSDQYDSLPLISWRMYQLMYRPVFKDKAQDEHDHAQGVIDDCWLDVILSTAWPEPLQHNHWQAICRPKWEDTPDRLRNCPLPCSTARISKERSYMTVNTDHRYHLNARHTCDHFWALGTSRPGGGSLETAQSRFARRSGADMHA